MKGRPPYRQTRTLEELLGWMGTAKENLPDANDAVIPSHQLLEMSALIDRMQRAALALDQELRTERLDRAA